MCKNTKKAYITIEASMVFPLVLGGIIFIIYLGFYLYNASVIKQVSYIAALRGSQLRERSSEQIKTYIEEQLQQLSEEKLLTGREIKQEIAVSFYEIKVKVKMDMTPWFLRGVPYMDKIWEIKKEAKVSRINPVDIIRGVRKINESKISE